MTDHIDTLRADFDQAEFDRELHVRSGGYRGKIRRAVHATSLGLIGVAMVLVLMAMGGGFPMGEGLQLAAIVIAPLAFAAFLSRPQP